MVDFLFERETKMLIKLLVGPAASGKSMYIRNHKAEDDITAHVLFDQLIIENQSIAYKLQKLTNQYAQLEDRTNIKHIIKDDFNGEMFSKLSRLYFKVFNKELTLWIESQTISEEDIELLKNSYKHRFELIRFDRRTYPMKMDKTSPITSEMLEWYDKYNQSQEIQCQINDKRMQEYEIIKRYNGIRHKETTTIHLPDILTTEYVNDMLDLFILQNQISSLQNAQNDIWK